MKKRGKTYEGKPCRRCAGTTRYIGCRTCIACARSRAAAWSTANPETFRARNNQWVKNNRAKANAAQMRYTKNNSAKLAAKTAQRRAAHLQRTPKWLTPEDKCVMREMYKEASRRTLETGVQWHVDHIVPLRGKNVCGLHVPSNLQLLPKTDNLRKGASFSG